MTTRDTRLRTYSASTSSTAVMTDDTCWKTRLTIVTATTLAPLLVWVVARLGFGLDVRSPTFNGQHFELGRGT